MLNTNQEKAMTDRHLRFKVVGTPLTELKLVDLGEIKADTTHSISSGKFEIVTTGKFEIVVEGDRRLLDSPDAPATGRGQT
jgi:hypothetical protein